MSFNLAKPVSFETEFPDTEFVVSDPDFLDDADPGLSPDPHLDAVTGASGWPLPEDGGAPFAACRAYLRAIHAGDWRALQGLVTGEATGLFDEGSDFRILQGLRPDSPAPVSGYCTDDRATVTVQGVTRGGFLATWTYQLRRLDGAWRIAGERWD